MYSNKLMLQILQKGSQLGFKYFNDTEPLTTEQAAEFITKDTQSRFLQVQYKDTNFNLRFYNNFYQEVLFVNLSPAWSKTFNNDETDIDVARYSALMLDLMDDYEILEMKAELVDDEDGEL